jgi:hypothetical protein
MDRENQDKLEIEFIDQVGLSNTLEAIANICLLKSKFIKENFTDNYIELALKWESIYRQINNCNTLIKKEVDYLQGKSIE